MKVNIQTVNFEADTKLKDFIEKRVNKLDTFYDRIIDAKVFLKLEGKTSEPRDKVVEIRLNTPGATLFSKEISKSFENSTDKAVESVRRQLKKYKQKKKR